ncbi:Alpha-L-fucosidase [Novipirellula aureliae]|uniref:alpha-L-fucosidase n=1 Tax=Novipirellula aureliae TaxID=2527966 RepID=A0A5C6E6N7_9BACT|nr:alpha-L-fucosidase [Novipirellula aureliae]TWU44275.1 Alpha-L-fucosidase [Novipirellula aureliae]
MKLNRFASFAGAALALMICTCNVSAQTAEERMQWFKDAKFGMFIHFGVHNQSKFNPDFNAGQWARVAKMGGMKYVVLTTKHHVGFCLWDSELSEYNVVDQTPYPRDIVKDLAAGCEAEGLEMGCYYSIAEYNHPLYEPKYQNRPNRRSGTVPGADINKYIGDYMFGQLRELCELYRPCLIWFDGGSGFSNPVDKPLLRRQEMVDMLHSYGTLSNSRLGDDDSLKFVDYMSMNDNMAPDINLGICFESAVCMGKSWNYTANDTVKSPQFLIEQLVNIVGNGGNYLLNVGPDQQGVIPEEMQERLKIMGNWLEKNGEAIYGTEAGPYRYEINWGSITQRKNEDSTSLYLNVADWPTDGKFTLFGVNNPVIKASLLATGEPIKSESRFDGASGQSVITLDIPKDAPDEYVSVIKLDVAGTVSMDPAHMQLNDGKVILDTYNATIHDVQYVPGKPTKAIDMKMFTVPDRRPQLPSDTTGPWDYQMYKKPGEGIMPSRAITVSGFQTKGQALSWDFKVFEPGTYQVAIQCSGVNNQNANTKGKLRATVAGQSIENGLTFVDRGHAQLGKIQIDTPGTYTFTLEVASDFNSSPRYGSVVLVPVSQVD